MALARGILPSKTDLDSKASKTDLDLKASKTELDSTKTTLESRISTG